MKDNLTAVGRWGRKEAPLLVVDSSVSREGVASPAQQEEDQFLSFTFPSAAGRRKLKLKSEAMYRRTTQHKTKNLFAVAAPAVAERCVIQP